MVLCKVSQRDVARKQATEDAALKDACSLLRQGHTVHQIVGPSKTIKAQQIWDWCAKQLAAVSESKRPPVSLGASFVRGFEKNSEAAHPFSLARLERENPGLARQFLWATNPMLPEGDMLWLHLGCGVRVFEGFLNLDICPQDPRVTMWNLLDMWPEELDEKVEGVFSEDCLEHFFLDEQTYILCNINRALKPTQVARILMPSLARLVETYSSTSLSPDEFLHDYYGDVTGGDHFNYGMRFTGHRWLHDQHSLARMAALCGFEATATDCASSSVAKFNGLNLRDESNSAAFANDLRKTRQISRILVSSERVEGAAKVEDLAGEAALFVATSGRPTVEYSLPQSVILDAVACINFRSSNLSSFDWPLKTLVIDEINRAKPWYFDETLKSQACMNVITKRQLKLILNGDQDFSRLSFSPAANRGEYFTVGCAEVFMTQ
jgi:predicted SAM-dependent methyltransferase